jgi:hypothetical protein
VPSPPNPPPAAPLLDHEDAESRLTVRTKPPGAEIAIERRGARPWRMTAPLDALREWAAQAEETIAEAARVADVPGPSDGRLVLKALVFPGEGGREDIMVMLQRVGAGGDEAEAEFVRFASRRQVLSFLARLAAI